MHSYHSVSPAKPHAQHSDYLPSSLEPERARSQKESVHPRYQRPDRSRLDEPRPRSRHQSYSSLSHDRSDDAYRSRGHYDHSDVIEYPRSSSSNTVATPTRDRGRHSVLDANTVPHSWSRNEHKDQDRYYSPFKESSRNERAKFHLQSGNTCPPERRDEFRPANMKVPASWDREPPEHHTSFEPRIPLTKLSWDRERTDGGRNDTRKFWRRNDSNTQKPTSKWQKKKQNKHHQSNIPSKRHDDRSSWRSRSRSPSRSPPVRRRASGSRSRSRSRSRSLTPSSLNRGVHRLPVAGKRKRSFSPSPIRPHLPGRADVPPHHDPNPLVAVGASSSPGILSRSSSDSRTAAMPLPAPKHPRSGSALVQKFFPGEDDDDAEMPPPSSRNLPQEVQLPPPRRPIDPSRAGSVGSRHDSITSYHSEPYPERFYPTRKESSDKRSYNNRGRTNYDDHRYHEDIPPTEYRRYQDRRAPSDFHRDAGYHRANRTERHVDGLGRHGTEFATVHEDVSSSTRSLPHSRHISPDSSIFHATPRINPSTSHEPGYSSQHPISIETVAPLDLSRKDLYPSPQDLPSHFNHRHREATSESGQASDPVLPHYKSDNPHHPEYDINVPVKPVLLPSIPNVNLEWNPTTLDPRRGHIPQSAQADLCRVSSVLANASIIDPVDSVEPGLFNGKMAPPAEMYKIVGQVGEGTFGTVFKARNTLTGAHVALKRLRMESEKDGFPVTAVREIKLLQSLRHPNIVQLHEMMIAEGNVHMVFEYVSHDLVGLLSQTQFTLTHAHIKSLCRQMLAGLAYLHHKAVIHRDMKASNVLVSAIGELKIADFGLARFYQKRRRLDYTNRIITLWYRPPELLLGATVYGPEVDMWSAGCIFLELFVTKPVFQGNDEIHQLEVLYGLLGSPDVHAAASLSNLPWWDLVQPRRIFKCHFREAFSRWLPLPAMQLAESLLTYDSNKRVTALQALDSPYFTSEPTAVTPNLSSLQGDWHEYEYKQDRAAKKRKVIPKDVAQPPPP